MAEITKMWIADKIREIMKHKPIDKIRVTEICRAADIEKPTFYYHFKDKYTGAGIDAFAAFDTLRLIDMEICFLFCSHGAASYFHNDFSVDSSLVLGNQCFCNSSTDAFCCAILFPNAGFEYEPLR